MEANRLTITGHVVETGTDRVSPAGVPQFRFRLEHRSRQVEAGTPREARCRVDVKVAGEDLVTTARALQPGQHVEIEGFLTREGHREGDAGIVLHATRITESGGTEERN